MSKMDDSVVTKVQCPIAIEWSISENRLKEFKDKPGECLYSDEYEASNIPGVEYCITFCPLDQSEDESGDTLICLHLTYSGDFNIKANFDVKIEEANAYAKLEYVFTETYAWGYVFCTSEEFFDPANRYIVDGKLRIKIEGMLTVEKEMSKKEEHFGNYSDDLCLGLWNQEEDKNFTVVAAGKEIMAHKCILATRSPVFAKMFSSGLKEAKENKVTIKDFPFEIVEMGIKYCYHHSIVTESSLEDKMQLLKFFNKYDIQQLKNDLESYLITEISESTVCRLINASLLSNALKLEKKCTEFLYGCFRTKPIADFDSLDGEFAMNFLKNSFCHISE